MISSVLVVCVGNICRSPIGERMLAQTLPALSVESAGINAVVGNPASQHSVDIAAENGISLDGHVSRQFTSEIAADFDLILALEKGHMKVIAEQAPEARGKTMLFGHWMDGKDIPDPYGKSREYYLAVFEQIREASEGWVAKLGST